MNIKYTKEIIELEKDITPLDSLTLDFVSCLRSCNVTYVIISGYIAILFGRNRASEDIDIIAEKIPLPMFRQLWNVLLEKFQCLNASSPEEAYKDYLSANLAVRFSRKDEFIPNVELKFAKNELDQWTLNNRKEVLLNAQQLSISPLELQIPFKLFLGSNKDIEDARFLYSLFKDNLDQKMLLEFRRKLNIGERFDRYLS